MMQNGRRSSEIEDPICHNDRFRLFISLMFADISNLFRQADPKVTYKCACRLCRNCGNKYDLAFFRDRNTYKSDHRGRNRHIFSSCGDRIFVIERDTYLNTKSDRLAIC